MNQEKPIYRAGGVEATLTKEVMIEILESPHRLEALAKEIRLFTEHFQENEHICWSDYIDDCKEHYENFFRIAQFLVEVKENE